MTDLVAPLEVRRLGRVEYDDGVRMQEAFVDAVAAKRARDTLLLLEHDDVITLGRAAKFANVLFSREELAAKGVALHDTTRGGDVTFHGRGQVVGYPILDLGARRETKDVRRYVRSLEELMIRTCADFGVRAERVAGLPGVFAGRDKIGAIGVRVSRWITSHGFALNVNTDLKRFDLIVACGIPDRGVTSLARETGRENALADVEDRLEHHAADVFGRDIARRDVEQTTIAVVVRRGAERLVMHRIPERGGFWQILTGRIEPGETPAQAAQRELREETGFEATVAPLGYEHAFALADTERLAREIVFVADVRGGSRIAPDEHDEHRWLDAAGAALLVRHAGHRRALSLS